MPVFFIASDQVRDGRITITSPLLDHLRGSLRIRPGEELWCGDERRRRRYRIRATEISRRALIGTILEERQGPPRETADVTVAPAILKGDRMDWLIQKAVELGISAIRPVLTERAIVRPKAGRHYQERWQRIATEAAQQSERWEIPVVGATVTVEDLRAERVSSTRLMLTERHTGMPLRDVTLDTGKPTVILVGPEGGWTAGELQQSRQAGWTPVTLGDMILRAETAAVAALAVVQHRLGRLG